MVNIMSGKWKWEVVIFPDFAWATKHSFEYGYYYLFDYERDVGMYFDNKIIIHPDLRKKSFYEFYVFCHEFIHHIFAQIPRTVLGVRLSDFLDHLLDLI